MQGNQIESKNKLRLTKLKVKIEKTTITDRVSWYEEYV